MTLTQTDMAIEECSNRQPQSYSQGVDSRIQFGASSSVEYSLAQVDSPTVESFRK